MTSAQSDQRILFGTDATLRCEARGNPTPTMSWQTNGDDILAVDGLVEISPNGTVLTLRNVTANDAGWYTCIASNKVRQSQAAARVTVIGL